MADRADVWMLIDQLGSLESQLATVLAERDVVKEKLRKVVADAFPIPVEASK